MGIVDDVLDRHGQLAADRSAWEAHWLDVSRYALPDVDVVNIGGSARLTAAVNGIAPTPVAATNSRAIYDQTSLWAIDRGTAGFLSLVTPQSQKWHDLKPDDPFAPEPTDEEKRWLEFLRDYMHLMRGNPQSGFWVAHKAAIRSVWGLGTGVMFVQEAFGRGASLPISYRYILLSECYLSANFEGVVDTCFRQFQLSARACVQQWGPACSADTKAMADDPKRKDQTVEIIHAVFPRTERGGSGNSNRDSRWASVYLETKAKHLIGESGYYSFPYIVHHWNRNNQGGYSEGPLAIALADVKSLNMLAKNALTAAQQAIAPPLATIDGFTNRINLNSNAVNAGLVSPDGKLLAQPIVTAQRPDFAEMVLNTKREQIKTSLYVNVWQSIIDHPAETATQSLLRAQEKGDLLGPAGNSIQHGLSLMVEREVDILERKGAFREGSPLVPPASMAGRSIGVRFSSPLDRLQRSNELTGAQQVVGMADLLAKSGKMDALDRLDSDEIMDLAQEVTGAPRRILKSVEAANQARQYQQQIAAMQQTIDMLKQGGDAGQSVAAGSDALAASPGVAGGLQGLLASAQPANRQAA